MSPPSSTTSPRRTPAIDMPRRVDAHNAAVPGAKAQAGIPASRALRLFFATANAAPWALRIIRPLAVRGAVRFSSTVLTNVSCNLRYITGRTITRSQAKRFARNVVGHFYDAVVDIASSGSHPSAATELFARVERVEGFDAYQQLRRQKRGVVLVTAHAGSFEIGLAALRQYEMNVHVVFKRDPFDRFESIRQRIHARLGVHEAPIDDGLASMIRLRDALSQNGAVVMQADRAMPGQQAQSVPFLSGHVKLPLGPVKLARLTDSPIVPVFVLPTRSGRFQIHLLPAIEVHPPHTPTINDVDPTLHAIGQVIAKFVEQHPEHWLTLDRAFVEDQTT